MTNILISIIFNENGHQVLIINNENILIMEINKIAILSLSSHLAEISYILNGL